MMKELLMILLLAPVFFLAVNFGLHAAKVKGRQVAWNTLNEPVTAKAPPYGSLIYFALDGDSVEGETVSVDDAPAGSVLDDWKELGCLESGGIGLDVEGGEQIYCFNSSTGKHEPDEVVGETTRLYFEFVVQKITTFILQMSRHAASMNATTGAIAHNSQAGAHYKGYLLVTQYNGTEQVVTDLVRAHLRLSNAMPIHSRTAVKPAFRADVISNSNNAGALGTESA